MNRFDFRGTKKLIQFYLRHDWITRLIWLLTPALLVMTAASSYGSMFASQQELSAFVDDSILNPAVSAIHGFILSKDIAGIVAWNVKTVSLIVIAIFNILAMTKIIRGEEESGRADLLNSNMAGRQSLFASSMALCLITNIIMGILMLLSTQLCGLPLEGSLIISALMVVGGCLFASIGALTSQIANEKRTANSLGIGLMGLLYMLSFMNNLSADNNFSSYFTPFRWFFIVRPYEGNHPAFLSVAVCLVVIIGGIALYLSGRRDVGAGVINPKSGRSEALPGFGNTFALSWRLHKGALIVWTLALGVFAFGIGVVDPLVSKMLDEQLILASWMSLFGEPEEAFLSLMIYVLCLFVSAYGILTIQKMRSEEVSGRIEVLLSLPVKRFEWMLSHIMFSVIGSAFIMVVIGLCTAFGSVAGGGTAAFGKIVYMAIQKLPAILIVGGIASLLFGFLPKLSIGGSWTIYSLLILIQLLWEMALVPDILFLLSPFGQVYPTQSLTVITFVLLLAVACALYGAGLTFFKKRDIQS